MASIMGQQNGTAQALFLRGSGPRPETYPLWNGPRLWSGRLLVSFQHRGANFNACRPLAAALPGVGWIVLKPAGIGLDHPAAFQKQEPRFIGRHADDKGFGLPERIPQARHGGGGVHRGVAVAAPEVLAGKMRRPADFGDDALRRKPRRLAHGRPYRGS